MKTGIDSLDLEPTDPLMINDFEVNREIPPVTIQTKLNNVGIKLMIYILVVLSYNYDIIYKRNTSFYLIYTGEYR